MNVYAMRARTRTLTTSRASRHRGTLRRWSSSIAGLQHNNALSIARFSFNFLSFPPFLLGVNALCYNIIFQGAIAFLLCCLIAVIHTFNSLSPPPHSLLIFSLCYAHSYTPT